MNYYWMVSVMRTENDVVYRKQALDLSCDLSQIKIDGDFQNSLLLHFINENEAHFAMKIAKRPDLSTFINMTDQQCGNSALLFAIKRGFFKLAQFLINHGADVSLVDASGHNALHYACYLRDEGLLRALCSSDSYKRTKEKCLQQQTRREHFTPVDLYLFESRFLFPSNLSTHNNLWDYRAAPPFEQAYNRPKVTFAWIHGFDCEQASQALLEFAKKHHEHYFKNRLYLQRVNNAAGGFEIIRPTDAQVMELENDNAQYSTAEYYTDHCRAMKLPAIEKLLHLSEQYLQHLERMVERPNTVAWTLLETKKETVNALLYILTDSSISEGTKIRTFQTDLSDARETLSKHRDTGWIAFLGRALSVITGIRFFYATGSVYFWRSHGEQFERNCDEMLKSQQLPKLC